MWIEKHVWNPTFYQWPHIHVHYFTSTSHYWSQLSYSFNGNTHSYTVYSNNVMFENYCHNWTTTVEHAYMYHVAEAWEMQLLKAVQWCRIIQHIYVQQWIYICKYGVVLLQYNYFKHVTARTKHQPLSFKYSKWQLQQLSIAHKPLLLYTTLAIH